MQIANVRDTAAGIYFEQTSSPKMPMTMAARLYAQISIDDPYPKNRVPNGLNANAATSTGISIKNAK